MEDEMLKIAPFFPPSFSFPYIHIYLGILLLFCTKICNISILLHNDNPLVI